MRRSVAIDDDASTTIEYTAADFHEATGTWVPPGRGRPGAFTAFSSKNADQRVTGRLVVRRFPDPEPAPQGGAGTLVRRPALPCLLHHHDPDDLDAVAADNAHGGHAIIEQVHA